MNISIKAETTPAVRVVNYKNDLAYLINGPITVVGSSYEDACSQLAAYGYAWKIMPSKGANPACYSLYENILLGAETWYCADGSLAYYNVPWWLCPGTFNTCPNSIWTLSSDSLTCSSSSASCSDPAKVSELKLLAALVYGEASVDSSFEEKAAIANAVIRFRNSYGYTTVNQLIAKKPYYSAAVHDKVVRYRQVMCSDVAIEYPELYEAVSNALDPNGIDYANGGCFWDGNDLATLGSKQLHYKKGYIFTDPQHDVFSIGDSAPSKNTEYDYTYESTAGYGHTVFWKYTQEFMDAEGVQQCR